MTCRRRNRAVVSTGAAMLVLASLAGCASRTGFEPLASSARGTHSALPPTAADGSTVPTVPGVATASADSPTPSLTTPTPVPVEPSPSPPPAPGGSALDIGGTTILPGHRVVAEYGAAGGAGLGVLGAGTPAQAAAAVSARAAGFVPYGEPVVAAMELIATVALGSPGPSGQYTSAPNLAVISSYLAAAKAANELLILDFQPGRASFIAQVQSVQSVLLDPDVSVALDPEWKVGPDQQPGGGFIGSARAADINAVGAYLSQLVAQHGLPQKLLVVHQFALSMLPDRGAITSPPGLAVVFHADGEGSIAAKLNTYRALAFPGAPFFAGFKLFLSKDERLMAPAEVMALPRRPDLITYQ